MPNFARNLSIQPNRAGPLAIASFTAWIAMSSPLVGCVHKRLAAADRGNSREAMTAVQPLSVTLPEGLQPFSITCAPVTVSAAPPGPPSQYRSTLERCICGSLASGAPKIELTSTSADAPRSAWNLEVDLQEFGPSGNTTTDSKSTNFAAGFEQKTKTARTWTIAASARLLQFENGVERVVDAWTVSITAESSANSTHMTIGPPYINLADHTSNSFSHSQSLAVLGQLIAQETVHRICKIESPTSTPTQARKVGNP
jgi:hypothetical protein